MSKFAWVTFKVASALHTLQAAPSPSENHTEYHGPLPKVPKNMGTIQLGAFIYDNFDLMDIMGPMRVFGESENELDLKINFIASSMKPVKSSQQVTLTPHYTLTNAPKMDLFIVPGGSAITPVTEKPSVMRQIKARVKNSTWTMTVCTGAGILAKTGLMDGFKMTTNKAAFKWVVDYVGNTSSVTWVKKARWVQDGKYVSTSGLSAGIDGALFVVSQLVNQTIAEKVASHLEYSWHKDANDDPFAELYPYTRS
ncbi:unnamed protein product [Mortierella alpina]